MAPRGPFDLTFGGPVEGGRLRLTDFVGAHTNGLRRLHVVPGRGLGGRVVEQARPAAVKDYGVETSISHEYDVQVLGEGIRSVAAVPVVTGRTVRGVVYGAMRGTAELGDRAVDHLLAAARGLSLELRVRDEVDRRVEALVQQIPDPRVREQVLALARADESPRVDQHTTLSPREVDVLRHVALGRRTEEIARQLSLRPETVKSYLRSAATKLGTHSRYESMLEARRLGLLP